MTLDLLAPAPESPDAPTATALLAHAIAPDAPPDRTDGDAPGTRPAEVPEKFWDAERGEVRVDALLASYRALERRLSARFAPPADDAPEEERARFRRALGVPEAPEGYAICERHALCAADP